MCFEAPESLTTKWETRLQVRNEILAAGYRQQAQVIHQQAKNPKTVRVKQATRGRKRRGISGAHVRK